MPKRTKRKRQPQDKDNALNVFMSKPEIFADLFNAYIYNGKQVIQPDRLEPADRLLSEVIGNAKGQAKLTRYRDVFKAYRDKNATYILLGIENQMAIHYAMPLRNMIYDSLSLLARLRQKSAKHLALKDLKRPDEFLSRFAKTDHIDPVITITVYYGSDLWDGPYSLHEMMRFPDETLKSLVPNYFLNLIVPAKMGEEMLANLCTELREVFKCIRLSQNKEEFYAFILNEPRCQEMSYEAVQAINACTHANIKITQKGGKTNMCRAIIELKQDAYNEGYQKGCQAIIELKQDAYNEGFMKGEESGFMKGEESSMSRFTLKMFQNNYGIKEISEITGLTPSKIEQIIQAQQQG